MTAPARKRKKRMPSGRRVVDFPQIKGKTVERIELYTSDDYHAISVRFQDRTSLNFAIDPGFTVKTDYEDWKTGNGRRLKSWPVIRAYTR